LPEAKFCRRCGSVITADVAAAAVTSSELPTLMLDEQEDPTTRGLTPRVTSPETPRRTIIAAADLIRNAPQPKSRSFVLIGLIVVLVLGALVGFVGIRGLVGTREDSTLIYPGSKTIVDFSSGDGRALQLQTDDSLEQVINWYETFMKPTKTMRLTSTSVVLKKDKVTTTLASEGGKTNILIKQVK
jgi:hypothetical protein